MNQLLEDIVKSIVDNSEAVKVIQTDENGFVHLTLHVHPDDIGRVIGKEGKIINSIRNLMRVAAIRKGKRVRVDLAEPDKPQPEPEEPLKESPQEAEIAPEAAPKKEVLKPKEAEQ